MRPPASEGFPPLTVASALTPIRWLGAFVLNTPPWVLGVLATLVAILRNGIHFDIGSEDFVAGAQELPRPLNWFSSSWGPLVLGRITNLDHSVWTWNLGYLVATLATLIGAVAVILSRPTPRRRIAVVLLACSPLPAVLLYGIGRYDLFLIIGSALVALGHRWWQVVLGAVIACSANPEQSMVSAICLLLVSLAPRFEAKRPHAYLFGGIAVANWLVMLVWYQVNHVDGSRILFFPVWIVHSVLGFIETFPLSLYSWFGALWLLVFFVVGSLTGASRWWVAAGLFALPGLFTITTLDGTRVFVCVVAAAAIFVVHEQLHTIEHGEIARLLPTPARAEPDPGNQYAFAGAITAAVMLMPSVWYFGFDAVISTPWEWFNGTFQSWVDAWEPWMQRHIDSFNQLRH